MIAFLLLSVLPADGAIVDRPELLEYNHVRKPGQPAYDQLIAWERSESDGKLHIAWYMHVANIAKPIGGEIIIHRNDRVIHVRASRGIETTTDYDPEVVDHVLFPSHQRRGIPQQR